jgi:ubiquinone/menaquinone biosynthesis C-methylase UbiE
VEAEVLEVGCGGGQLARSALERRADLRWTGLDTSTEQIARARERNASHEGATFVVGDALELPFPDARFDAVVSIASIKHWPDQAKGLSECVRVLRPGGQLLVVEADRGCRLEDARSFVSRWRLPTLMRPLNVVLFRALVAGRSLDLDDARALMSDLPLASWEVTRIEGTPALLMRGERHRLVA